MRERLDRLFKQRIVIFDGSMGVMLQKRGLSDAEFRGERFKDHPKPLRNNSDILCLSQPDMVTKVHLDYLEAGPTSSPPTPSLRPPSPRPTTACPTSPTR